MSSRHLFAVVFAGVFGLSLAAFPLFAHHSFAAEFDGLKPVKVTGVVKKVEWTNPHTWFYVYGKYEISGRAGVWGCSGGGPGLLSRRAIPRDAMTPADTCQAAGLIAKDG